MENNNKNNSYNKEIILFKNISLIDKYNFYEYISVMLEGGVSIIESLQSVESKISSPYFRQKIKELIIYVSSGDSFSKSMKKMPDIFGSTEVSVIEAGEITGKLSMSLLKLSDDFKKIHNLRNKIKGALTYPFIIFLFLFFALIIILTFVIPEIKPLFDTAEVELPMSTKVLLIISNFVVDNLGLIFLFISSLFVFLFGYKNTSSGKRAIEEFILGLPLIGKVYRNYILSNIASNLGTLLGSGVTILKALNLTGKATNNKVYEGLFEDIIIKVSSGEQIVKSIEAVDPYKEYFPTDYLQMLAVGERTANIDKIAKRLNDQYTKEVDYSLVNLTKWIEPLAILFASVFVIWFAYAILGAIIKITQTVG